MNYNELSQTAHADAVQNGWYEQPQPINTYIALIKTELSEMFDAFRSGKNTELSFEYMVGVLIDLQHKSGYTNSHINIFKLNIKDTFEDEAADIAIRILDFCGWYKITLPKVVKIQTKTNGLFPADFVAIDKLLTAAYDETGKTMLGNCFAAVLGMLESIAEVYDFDLEQHIHLKMAYNKTRGYKHGNKVV